MCIDANGENIANEIEYGGHVINTARPGIYKVHYTCRGVKETRTVVVKEGAPLRRAINATNAAPPPLPPQQPPLTFHPCSTLFTCQVLC